MQEGGGGGGGGRRGRGRVRVRKIVCGGRGFKEDQDDTEGMY